MHFLTVVKKITETEDGVDVGITKCVVDTDTGSVERMMRADHIDCYAIDFDETGEIVGVTKVTGFDESGQPTT